MKIKHSVTVLFLASVVISVSIYWALWWIAGALT